MDISTVIFFLVISDVFIQLTSSKFVSLQKTGDRGGVVLEHRTLDEEVPGSIHTGGTVLCP